MKRGPPGGLWIKKIFKNLLVKSHKVYSFDIRYVISSSGPQQKLLKVCPYGQKARGLIGFIYNYIEKNILVKIGLVHIWNFIIVLCMHVLDIKKVDLLRGAHSCGSGSGLAL